MKLEEMRKLCESATPGPWLAVGSRKEAIAAGLRSDTMGWMERKQDTAFVVMARAEMLKLITVAEAARRIPQQPSPSHRLLTPGWIDLNIALNALESDP